MLADLDSLERRVDGLAKKAKGSDKDAAEAKETLDLVNRALVLLREGKPARLVERKPEEEKRLSHARALDLDAGALRLQRRRGGGRDRQRPDAQSRGARAGRRAPPASSSRPRSRPRSRCCRRGERADYLAAIGLREPGLDRLIRAGYALLNLITYFTAGPKEAAAWTITRGTKAPQAAAVIHSRLRARLHPRRDHRLRRLCDLRRRDRRATGRQDAARGQGLYRRRHGDVMHFRFAT